MWYIPVSGAQAGEAFKFASGPMECELTGPFLTRDERTLFLSVQHPGELHGIRRDDKSETRRFAMKTTTGESFTQTREVPLGSNWPGKKTNDPARSAVVAIRRRDGKKIQ
jgi:secreted PhoX family phosphatase